MSSPRKLCWYTSDHITRGRFDGVTAFQPALQSAGEWSHVRDSLPFECERHTGAGRLVRSRAVEHQSLTSRNLLSSCFKILRGQLDRARKHAWLDVVVHRMPKINDHKVSA